MSSAQTASLFPPMDSVLTWVDPETGAQIAATAVTYRESAGLRVYSLRVDPDTLLYGVMDADPDTGLVTMVVSAAGAGDAQRVRPEIQRA